MIAGGTSKGGTGNAPFPDPPRGDPGAITGAAATFHGRTHALSGYATALDHCQSEMRRLRHAWEEAKHRQAAADALALKLVTAITPATTPHDATRLTTQATTASHQATDAGTEADGYAHQATTALTAFRQKVSTDQTALEGYKQ